jgi:hypothetical protein
MSNLPLSTIRAKTLNERAPKNNERLFQGLESFANLGDSFQVYLEFVKKWPTFFPAEVRDINTGEPLGFLLDHSCHLLVKFMRDYLRRVWRSEDEALKQQVPRILLGLTADTAKGSMQQLDSQTDFAFKALLGNVSNRSDAALSHPVISIDWIKGEFSYSPLNDFQHAVYLLFRENWRARSCSQCRRLFVAGKPAQLYCSVVCSVAARQRRDRDLWKMRGAAKRKARQNQLKRRKLGGRPPKKGKGNGTGN